MNVTFWGQLSAKATPRRTASAATSSSMMRRVVSLAKNRRSCFRAEIQLGKPAHVRGCRAYAEGPPAVLVFVGQRATPGILDGSGQLSILDRALDTLINVDAMMTVDALMNLDAVERIGRPGQTNPMPTCAYWRCPI